MYKVEYISCRVCGADRPRWLGTRGNREHAGAIRDLGEHRVTSVVQCRSCTFVYTNPLIVNQTDPDAGYGDPLEYEASSSVGAKALFNTLLDRIELVCRPPGDLLDIGCGKGEFLCAARERGWTVKGIERSRGMADHASQLSDLDVFCGELDVAPWKKSVFDVITLNMVLEHIDKPNDLLRGLMRFLKKGGILFVEVPNMKSLMLDCARWYFKLKGLDWSPLLSPLHPPYHCYGYTRRALETLMRPWGLEPKKAFVTSIGLRGFRSDGGHSVIEKWTRDVMSWTGDHLGRGDVLLMIFKKVSDVEWGRNSSRVVCESSS